jgi:hypothetical protein
MAGDLSIQFLGAKERTYEVLHAVRSVAESIKKMDVDLERRLRLLAQEIAALKFDPQALLPITRRVSGEEPLYEDVRIAGLIQRAFPPGHAFHVLYEQLIESQLGDLGRRVRELDREFRRYLYGESSQGSEIQ